MKQAKKIISASVSLLIAQGIFSAPGLAQASGQSTVSLEEVVVTARRVEESIQDVPISITVYEQKQLDDLNIVTVADLATVTTSLSANTGFGAENASLALRGFRQAIDTAPSVGVYFADVVVPRGATAGVGTRDVILPGSMFDLQNLQILKGPQGTLFGRNTTGGALLLVPREPGAEFGGYLEGSIGNYDMSRVQGAIDLPVADSFRMRFSADHQKRDGYNDNLADEGSEFFDDINYTAVRGSFIWDASDNLQNHTILSYYDSETNGTVQKMIACDPTGYDPIDIVAGFSNFIGGLSCGQLAAEKERGAGFRDLQSPVDGLSEIEQWQFINSTTWELSDAISLKNIFSYSAYENTQRTSLFGTNWQVDTLPAPYPALFSFGVPSILTAINPAPGSLSADQTTLTEEFRIVGSLLEDDLVYQAGIYYEQSDPESLLSGQSPTLVVCDDIANLNCIDPMGSAFSALAGQEIHVGQVGLGTAETEFRNQGVYAQTSYDFTESLRLTAGFRYTWDEQQVETSHRTVRFPVVPPYDAEPVISCTDVSSEPSCRNTEKSKSDAPTWVLGIDYFPSQDLMLYAKYARGYRAGGIVARAPVDYRVYDPEELDNYEIGFKSSFYGDISGTLNVGFYYNELTDQQVQVGYSASTDAEGNTSGAAPVTGIANAGEARLYGADVDASLIPFEGFILNLGYTWIDAEIRKIEDVVTQDPLYEANTDQIKPGAPILQTPEHQVSLSANYTLPLDESIGSITLGVNYVYSDEQLTSYAYENPELRAIYGGNLAEIPSIELWNANLSWEEMLGTSLDLSMFVTNLADEEYYAAVTGLAATGFETAVLGQPRMYGMRLRYRFGNE